MASRCTVSPVRPAVFRVSDAAKYAGIGTRAVYDLIAAGVIRPIRRGRCLSIARTELDRVIALLTEDGTDVAQYRRVAFETDGDDLYSAPNQKKDSYSWKKAIAVIIPPSGSFLLKTDVRPSLS